MGPVSHSARKPLAGMQPHAGKRVASLTALLFACALFVSAFVGADTAFAGSYKIGPINIDATVTTDGVINVVDTRTMEFSGRSTYVYWDFPRADNEQGYYVIDGVTEVTASGQEIEYTRTDDKTTMRNQSARVPQTYYVDETETTWGGPDSKLYLYFDETDTTSSFRIAYHTEGMVDAHEDVGEAYWQYVAANHNVVFRDVSVTVHLPVPAGEQAVTWGSDPNVRAWDQGGIYSWIDTGSDGVVHIYREKIAMGESGETRAVFPVSWLTGKVPSTDKHLDEILDDQQTWARRTSEMRTRSDLRKTGGGITMLLIDGIVVAFALIAFIKWGRQYAPDYHEKYLREIPTRDHPVILGEVWKWGHIENRFLVTGLVHLASLGCVVLERDDPSEHGETPTASSLSERWFIRLVEAPSEELESPIDSQTYEALAAVADGSERISFRVLQEHFAEHPEEFAKCVDEWHAAIKGASKRRGFFESTGRSGRRVLLIIGFALLAVSLIIYIPFAVGYESWYLGTATIVSVLSSFVVIFCGLRMKRRSEEAADLQVRLFALRRWMRDLPASDGAEAGESHDERPERSAEDWAQLLEVAEVFGLVEKLLSHIGDEYPEVLEDEQVRRVLVWFDSDVAVADEQGGKQRLTPARLLEEEIASLGGVEDVGSGFGGGKGMEDVEPEG